MFGIEVLAVSVASENNVRAMAVERG